MNPAAILRSAIQENGKTILFYQSALLTCVMSITYILYCLKDTLLVHHLGPEAVVFIRSYLVPPTMFVFFLFYAKLLNIAGPSRAFNFIVVSFVSYYALFAFYLYPNLNSLRADFPIDHWSTLTQIAAEIFVQWPITFHYLVSELWVIFVLGVMTWQLFNAINTKKSASDTYSFLQLVANVAISLAGLFVYQLGKSGSNHWSSNLQMQTVIIGFLAFLGLYLKSKLLAFADPTKTQESRGKLQLSIKESLRLIVSSKQLRLLFAMMFCYGMCNSFLETTNRYYLHTISASIQEYNSWVALQAMFIGGSTIAFIFLGAYFSSQKQYRTSLRITPLILAFSSLSILLLSKLCSGSWRIWPLLISSIAQIVLVKSSKYGLIDPSKEISYMSLDKELKNKGKAAVDGLSNRFGKTGGNFFQQIVFILAGSLGASIDFFAIVILLLAILWLHSATRIEI